MSITVSPYRNGALYKRGRRIVRLRAQTPSVKSGFVTVHGKPPERVPLAELVKITNKQVYDYFYRRQKAKQEGK